MLEHKLRALLEQLAAAIGKKLEVNPDIAIGLAKAETAIMLSSLGITMEIADVVDASPLLRLMVNSEDEKAEKRRQVSRDLCGNE